MASQYSYGYLKEAVKAHLDLEEDELEVMNINQRFHIFANEAIQQICSSKPKYTYFQFDTVNTFPPLVYDDGVIRIATVAENNWESLGLSEPPFATDEETAEWYNQRGTYLVGQVITMPADFLAFAVKKAFVMTNSLTNKIEATKAHITYLSNSELLVHYAATYLIPYQATWFTFAQNTEEDALVLMPSDLALTIPIYVASICLEQRNLSMAGAKRQAFEIALARCKSTNFLENKSVTPSFK
jgi:hypothetical protein